MNRTTAKRWFNIIVDNLLKKGCFDVALGYHYRMTRKAGELQYTSAYLYFKDRYVSVFDDVKIDRNKDNYYLVFFWCDKEVHRITLSDRC